MFPIFADQYPDFQLQTAPVPAGAGGSISVVGGESVVLTAIVRTTSPPPSEFMRYLLSKDSQLAMAEVGQMPVLSSLGADVTSIHDYYGAFVDQLATARPRPPTPAWTQIDQVLQAQTQLAFRGDATVQEALDGRPNRSTLCWRSTTAESPVVERADRAGHDPSGPTHQIGTDRGARWRR